MGIKVTFWTGGYVMDEGIGDFAESVAVLKAL